MIEIDKNIPIPDKSSRIGRKKYPLDEMEIGDSFFVQITAQKISGCFAQYKPKKFATRKVEGGVRVWRIE